MVSDNQPEATNILIANAMFPEAGGIFSTVKTLDEVKDNCLIAIDTNALLIPYLVGSGSFAQIRKTYNALAEQKRIIIPGQVAREFAKNRSNKITELYQQINRRKIRLQKGPYPLFEEIPAYKESIELENKIDELLEMYHRALDVLLETIVSWEWNDPVSKMYREVIGTDRVFDPAFDRDEIIKEFRSRFQSKIPPGYKDSGKEDEGIGDFLIWKSILELGKTQQKSVILVSGDLKPDWRIKSEGRPLYPRYELVDEFRRSSGGYPFYLIQFSDFLRIYGATPDTVQEVRQTEQEISAAAQEPVPMGIPVIRVMPIALVQILEVCDEVFSRYMDYSQAIKIVAIRLGISEKSVADKCTRKIDINTEQFRELLRNKDELINHLIAYFPAWEVSIRGRLAEYVSAEVEDELEAEAEFGSEPD